MVIDRRSFIKKVGLGGSMVVFSGGIPLLSACSSEEKKRLESIIKEGIMPHELPKLPYAYNALEPVIDEATVTLHHDKHHAGYVTGLNNAEKKLAEARESGDFSLVKHWERELAFHGSGHILHSIYWQNLSPNGGGKPDGKLAEAIGKDFGGFSQFRSLITAASNSVEGSGWGILAYQPIFDSLVILQTEKHQDLTQWGALPILVIDVWEHAYYLKYQNKRSEYVENLFQILNWDDVENRFGQAMK